MKGEMTSAEKEAANSDFGTMLGCILGFALHFVVICLVAQSALPELIMFLGVVQVVYMGPLIFVLRSQKKRRPLIKGLLLSIALLFLINALCVGVLVFD